MYRDMQTGGEVTPEARRALRRDCLAVASRARWLLPDSFIVGGEVTGGTDGPRATIAVQPPAGSVVSAAFDADEEADHDALARELAASAALEAKRTPEEELPAA